MSGWEWTWPKQDQNQPVWDLPGDWWVSSEVSGPCEECIGGGYILGPAKAETWKPWH